MSTSKFPKITEEGLADLRKRIGVKITDTTRKHAAEMLGVAL